MAILFLDVDGWPWAPYLAVKVATGKTLRRGVARYLSASAEDTERYWAAVGWAVLSVDTPHLPRQGYEGILEHVIVRFVAKCSRICSHELVRHRLVSYAQTSTRLGGSHAEGYREVMEELCPSISRVPLAVSESGVEAGHIPGHVMSLLERLCVLPWRGGDSEPALAACITYFRRVCRKLEDGEPGEVDAALRYAQPDALAAHVMATTNLREVLHILQLRMHPHAHWEIRNLASELADRLWSDYRIPIHLMLALKRPGLMQTLPTLRKHVEEQLDWLSKGNPSTAQQVAKLLHF